MSSAEGSNRFSAMALNQLEDYVLADPARSLSDGSFLEYVMRTELGVSQAAFATTVGTRLPRLVSSAGDIAGRVTFATTASSPATVYSRAASSDPKQMQPDSTWVVQSFRIVRTHPQAPPTGLSVALVTRPEGNDVFVRLAGYGEGTRFVAWIPGSPDDMPAPPREAIMQRPTVSGLVPLYLPEEARPELASELRLAIYLGSDLDPSSLLWLTRL